MQKSVAIGTVVRMTGLSKVVLRYWEKLGLIKPLRSEKGRRRYDMDQLKEIIRIKELLKKHRMRVSELVNSTELLKDNFLKTIFDNELEQDIDNLKSGTGDLKPGDSGFVPDSMAANIMMERIERRIAKGKPLALIFLDILHLDEFRQRYGEERTNKLLNFSAVLILDMIGSYGNAEDSVHHLGQGRFIILTTPNKFQGIIPSILSSFQEFVVFKYDEKDQAPMLLRIKSGLLEGKDQPGKGFPVAALKVLVQTNRKFINQIMSNPENRSADSVLNKLKETSTPFVPPTL